MTPITLAALWKVGAVIVGACGVAVATDWTYIQLKNAHRDEVLAKKQDAAALENFHYEHEKWRKERGL
jgi:hypothetical protein